jgi:hypothetical protein
MKPLSQKIPGAEPDRRMTAIGRAAVPVPTVNLVSVRSPIIALAIRPRLRLGAKAPACNGGQGFCVCPRLAC